MVCPYSWQLVHCTLLPATSLLVYDPKSRTIHSITYSRLAQGSLGGSVQSSHSCGKRHCPSWEVGHSPWPYGLPGRSCDILQKSLPADSPLQSDQLREVCQSYNSYSYVGSTHSHCTCGTPHCRDWAVPRSRQSCGRIYCHCISSTSYKRHCKTNPQFLQANLSTRGSGPI